MDAGGMDLPPSQESRSRYVAAVIEPKRPLKRHSMVTSIKTADLTMTGKAILDFGADAAFVSAAFVVRNSIIIVTLTAFALIALAGS
jgi:RNase P/RNase MRP subunit POP5